MLHGGLLPGTRVKISAPCTQVILFYHGTGTQFQQFNENGALMAEIDEKELVVTIFRASGPGGQKKNKTSSAVRLKHLPTGIIVTATESRSQLENREKALERLQERLAARQRRAPRRIATRPGKAAKARRLDEKKHRARIKQERGKPQG
jgi:protein subunit release factor A